MVQRWQNCTMAMIEKRGELQWRALVRKRGFPTQSRTFTTRRDAEAWARQTEAELDRGLFIQRRDAERTSFDQVAKRFIKEYAPHHYRSHGWDELLSNVRARLGKYALAAITPQLVAEYRDKRLTDPDPRFKDAASAPRVSGARIRKEIDQLSKVLDVASKEFGIALPSGNPCKLVRRPAPGGGRERRLVGDEEQRLTDACTASKNPWLLAAVQLSLETSMRQGELLSLRWENVNTKRGVAFLPMTKNGEARAVPLSPTAIAVLDTLPRNIDGRVIPLKKEALQGAFRRACARAKIIGLTYHDLRHEAISRLAERGDFNVMELAAVSGHKTLQMLKRYTHLQAEKLAQKMATPNTSKGAADSA